jgi:curved DNA-binding protein CbpA
MYQSQRLSSNVAVRWCWLPRCIHAHTIALTCHHFLPFRHQRVRRCFTSCALVQLFIIHLRIITTLAQHTQLQLNKNFFHLATHRMSEYNLYLSLFLWAILPELVTLVFQTVYYLVRYPVDSRAKPQSGSRQYATHKRRIYTLVVLVYLSYTIYEAYQSIPANHYNVLGLHPQHYTTKELKSNFKKLSLQYHPDKFNGDDAHYIKIRAAYDTLNSNNIKYIYDRFGNEGSECTGCKTQKEYLWQAFPPSLGFYAGTGVVLVLFSVSGKAEFGRYWRYVTFAGLVLLELALVMREDTLLHRLCAFLVPNSTVHDQVTVARQLYMTLFIALSQIGPVWFPQQQKQDMRPLLMQLLATSELSVKEVSAGMQETVEPFKRDETMVRRLQDGIEKIAVDLKLADDPEHTQIYSRTLDRVITRRKQ